MERDGAPILLFVDDEEAQLQIIRRLLRREPIDIRTTTDQREALRWLASEPVAALFSDLAMPEMDGFELLALARDTAPQTIRGIISGKLDLATAGRAVNEGLADVFMTKPVRKDELASVVHRALRLHDEKAKTLASVREAQENSLTDTLTGLRNRRFLEEELRRLLAVAKRGGEPAMVLFIDVNDFKLVNDTLGHEAGDRVLLQVADTLRAICRETDIPGRYAGDEFLVLAERTGPEQGVALLDRLCHASIEVPVPGREEPHRVTLSPGAAFYPDDGDTPEILIHVADEAMYRYKQARKANRAGAAPVDDDPRRDDGTDGDEPPVVLLVDDEAQVRQTIRRQLRGFRVRIEEATSAEESLPRLESLRPAVIVSDLSMPGTSGVDFLAEARRLYPDARRILLTAHGDFEVARDAVARAQVHHLLAKPWAREELIQAIGAGLPASCHPRS